MEKLKISVETGDHTFGPNPIVALFNPNQITIDKNVPWVTQATATRDVPDAQFTHGEAATLSMDLFFDTYEERTNVKLKTDKLYHLGTVEKHGQFHRPPICRLSWGAGIFFQGVLTRLSQRFTLFLADGTPVRATLSCSFRQWRSSKDEKSIQKLESADVAKRRIVKRGDTLSSIANEEYRDPSLWRPIADANQILNPRLLIPGTPLLVPALRGGIPVAR